MLRNLKRVFPDTDRHGATIFAATALDPAKGGAVGIDPRRYVAKARRACGSEVARLSWAVFVHLPGAPMASTGDAAVITARTAEGWRPWYVIYPAFRTSGFVE